MNYPVWYLPTIGGGSLIALIAVTHVYVSHFAVGGGLYLVFAERKGLREKNRGVLDFTRSHAKFFLLMTVVFGAVSGVGIWFIISLVNPDATSLLIHTFVFAWATEWVLFLVEAVAIFVYFYTFRTMDPRTHQTIGWIYAGAAWLSLFLVNGVVVNENLRGQALDLYKLEENSRGGLVRVNKFLITEEGRLARLTGAIDRAAHDRHGYAFIYTLQAALHILGHLD